MDYFNTFNLIFKSVKGQKLTAKTIMAEVNRAAVIKNLEKSKDGLPRHFFCTDENIEEYNLSKMPFKAKDNLLKLHEMQLEFPQEVLPGLLELKTQYPNVPCIYNYLSVVYKILKEDQSYYNILVETNKKFPDYLFGKTALAEYYLNNGHYKEVPKILEKKFELYMHFPPTRKIFHISEVHAFFSVIGHYYIMANKMARALFCYFILDDLSPDHPSTDNLRNKIALMELDRLRFLFKK